MDPVILYAILAVAGLLVLVAVSRVSKDHRRSCPGCDEQVDIHARACRYCGYRFGRT